MNPYQCLVYIEMKQEHNQSIALPHPNYQVAEVNEILISLQVALHMAPP